MSILVKFKVPKSKIFCSRRLPADARVDGAGEQLGPCADGGGDGRPAGQHARLQSPGHVQRGQRRRPGRLAGAVAVTLAEPAGAHFAHPPHQLHPQQAHSQVSFNQQTIQNDHHHYLPMLMI